MKASSEPSPLRLGWADSLYAAAGLEGLSATTDPETTEAAFAAGRRAALSDIEAAAPEVLRSLFPADAAMLRGAAKQGSLVRCVAMVQDVQGESSFLAAPPSRFFSACAGADVDIDESAPTVMSRCAQAYLVPLPGHAYPAVPTSDESRQLPARTSPATSSERRNERRPRRSRDDSDDDCVAREGAARAFVAAPTPVVSVPTADVAPRSGAPLSELVVTEAPADDLAAPQGGIDVALGLPHPATHAQLRCGAVAFLPDGTLTDNAHAADGDSSTRGLRPNDVVEAYGFVVAPAAAGLGCGGGSFDDDDDGSLPAWRAAGLPAGLVQTVIVVACRRLASCDHVHQGLLVSPEQPPLDMAALKPRAIAALARHLNSDTLAAEFLLLHLVGCVTQRTPSAAVGTLPLSLGGVPDPAGLVDYLHGIMPTAVHMTVDTAGARTAPLAASSWTPTQCFDRNSLQPTPLQLPAAGATLVVCDVSSDPRAWTHVHDASDSNKADFTHRNRLLLADTMSAQTLELDYVYSSVTVPTNTAVLLLAGPGKAPSIFVPTLVAVPVAEVETPRSRGALSSHEPLPDDEMLAFLRAARHAHRQSVSASVPDTPEAAELREYFAHDLVATQRALPELFRDTSLVFLSTHNVRMSVARALASTEGSVHLTKTAWEAMKQLELRRFERLSSRGLSV